MVSAASCAQDAIRDVCSHMLTYADVGEEGEGPAQDAIRDVAADTIRDVC